MQIARGASLSDADPAASPGSAAPRRPARLLLIVAAVVVVLDQVAKALAVRELTGRAPVELIGGLLQLRLVRNPGAAFGLAGGMTVFFTAVAVVVVIVVVRASRRLGGVRWALALGLLLGGAVGNLVDRVARSPGVLRGHVVDMFELPHWPVFNVADMAIVSAAALMVLLSARGEQLDGTRDTGKRHG